MSNYLLDANRIIYLSKDEDDQNRKETLQQLQQILQDDSSRLFVTPLVAYEALRGVKWENKQELAEIKNILQQFEMLDVNTNVAQLASDLYRLDVHESTQKNIDKNFDKRNFDSLHFATAKVNKLDVLSKDKHMQSFEKLHQRLNGYRE